MLSSIWLPLRADVSLIIILNIFAIVAENVCFQFKFASNLLLAIHTIGYYMADIIGGIARDYYVFSR